MIDGAFARSEDRRNGLERDYLQKIGHLRSKSEDFHNLKCARVTAFILENYSVEIDEGELLFGRYTTAFRPTPALEDEYRQACLVWDGAGALKGSDVGSTGHRAVDLKKLLKNKNLFLTWGVRMLGVPAVELLIFALLGLHGTVPTIVLLLEACPCAAITTMFAIQFHHDEELAAGAVVFSTLSSILTLPLYALLLTMVLG